MRIPARFTRWGRKQAAAAPNRFYGNGGTIHTTDYLDVEVYNGTVVAVWFRCQMLPFQQRTVDGRRATEMERAFGDGLPAMTGVEVDDLTRVQNGSGD